MRGCVTRNPKPETKSIARQAALEALTRADQFLVLTLSGDMPTHIEALCDSEWATVALLELGKRFAILGQAIEDVAARLTLDRMGRSQRPDIEETEW